MSAENAIGLRFMDNGEFWVVGYSCGDTCLGAQGANRVLGCAQSYKQAIEDIRNKYENWDHPEFYPTEYGSDVQSEERLRKGRVSFVGGEVYIRIADRQCCCLCPSDLQRHDWTVTESSELRRVSRTIGKNLTYAEALTLAHTYAMGEPASKVCYLPEFFHDFDGEGVHQCSDQSERELPKVAEALENLDDTEF